MNFSSQEETVLETRVAIIGIIVENDGVVPKIQEQLFRIYYRKNGNPLREAEYTGHQHSY